MLKKIVKLSIILLLFINSTLSYAQNEESILDDLIRGQVEYLNMKELEDIVRDINRDTNNILPDINFKESIISIAKGEDAISLRSLLKGITNYFFKELSENWRILSQVLFLSIICSVLVNIQSSFENETVGELSFYICYLVLIGLSINSFMITIKIAGDAINDMVLLMQALLPGLMILLLAIGGITSSSLFKPLILGAISAISTLMKDLVLPLILISSVIGIVSNISEKLQVSKLSEFIRKGVIYIIGISITLFMGIMSIKGAIGSKIDGLTIRTAKFAVNKFIPIVGSFLSDTMETVVGCSMVIKNSVGIFGLIALFLITIIPIIKITSLILVYKFTIVVIEPIANKRIVNCLSDISKSLTLLLATVAIVGIMFFIIITIIIGTGNATVMLR